MTGASDPAGPGVILLAHGSRDPGWCERFEEFTRRAVRDAGAPVRLAFMEFAQPDLMAAADALHRIGVRRLRILPLFLAAGAHLRRDIPELARRVAERFPDLTVDIDPAVGEDAEFAAFLGELLLRRCRADPA